MIGLQQAIEPGYYSQLLVSRKGFRVASPESWARPPSSKPELEEAGHVIATPRTS
jgi:hypothetical protein